MRDLNIEPIRSVERAIQILNCFSFENPVLTIDDIMKQTNLVKATTYRMLWTLEKNSLIQYDQKTNEYRLGTKSLEYAGIVLQHLDIRREAEPFLMKLHENTGHSVLLATPQGESIQYLLRIDSNEGLQPNNFIGRKRIIHNGALGIVLLAYMEKEFVQELLDEYPIEALTPYTLVDPIQFLRRLQMVKEDGVFVDVNETFVGYTAIAAPIFRERGKAIAAIAISGASFKMEEKRKLELKEQVMDTAKKISEKMGYVAM